MDNEIGAIIALGASQRNRQNTIDALKLQMKLEKDADKKLIYQTEIDRVMELKQRETMVFFGFMGALALVCLFVLLFLC